ncbi:MAG: diguanylate cyclase [Bacillota bacterium]
MNLKIMDQISNGIIVERVDTAEIIYINDAVTTMLQLQAGQTVATMQQLFGDEVVFERVKKQIHNDLKTEDVAAGTAYFQLPHHAILEVHFSCSWLEEEKSILCYVIEDATEVVIGNELSFRELADCLPSGILVMDVENDLEITYANREYNKILGISNEGNAQNKAYVLEDFIFEEDLNWVLDEIFEKIAKNEDVDIEFRMKVNAGQEKWIRFYGRANTSFSEKKLFYSSIKDLSQRRNINDKLHMERIIFHKITELTEETLFRLDLQTNVIHFLGKKTEVFKGHMVYENYPESILKFQRIHREDLIVHKKMIDNFKKGIEETVELRCLVENETYEWYRLTYSFIKNAEDEPILIIGKISNIHNQKILEEQAKTDALTGFYNKVTTEKEINQILQKNNAMSHTFFIVDIDHFKSINDNLGHHFGDLLLVSVAEDIRSCFRENDVLGRIGGDEFVILMRETGNTAVIIQKASLICEMLNKTFSGSGKQYSISASVGISMYPTDGTTYEELYKKSDAALYEVKGSGKNGFKQFYSEMDHKKTTHIPKKQDDNRMQPMLMNNKIVSTVLNLIYETKDLKMSMNSILSYIGTAFKLSKCYIFETYDEGESFQDAYQWYSEVKHKNPVTQLMSGKSMEAFLTKVNEEGIYYTNDVSDIEDEGFSEVLMKAEVKSLFIIDSMKHYQERGIFVVEDCKTRRVWSEEEIVTLLHIARLLFTGLNYYNKIEHLLEQVE